MAGQPDATEDPERAALRALIERFHGNHSEMAKALGLENRQSLSRRLERHGLVELAASARARASVKGPRPHLEDKDGAHEALARRELVAAIAANGGYRAAARVLGISPRTMARRMKQLGVTPDEVTRERALRASG